MSRVGIGCVMVGPRWAIGISVCHPGLAPARTIPGGGGAGARGSLMSCPATGDARILGVGAPPTGRRYSRSRWCGSGEAALIRRDAWREYSRGSLWLLPMVSVVLALLLGTVLSRVPVPAGSPLAFQGTADDARALLIGITATMVTVIALLLGLAVVALQLSSTQFSPGCCATICATARTRSCSACSSAPLPTAPEVRC